MNVSNVRKITVVVVASSRRKSRGNLAAGSHHYRTSGTFLGSSRIYERARNLL